MPDYIVSARKYRPDSFSSLIGQDNIARTLKNSIVRGQLAHAYLFCGPRGVGKTSAARIFAKTINCSSPSGEMEPCGKCESCESFAEGRSYCIHELDAASNNGVEDIKALMEQVQIPPQVGRYSVYIIDEVHMLSQQAFNAFLKTLEEPPSYAIFILCTTEKHKIIPTILSRCQTYDFNRISVPDIVRNLREIAEREEVKIDDESMHVIARKADGAMRDALTIFDQTVAFCGSDIKYADVIRNLNVLDVEYGFSLVDAFLAGDYRKALLTFDEILSKGFNAQHFISELGMHLRNLLVTGAGGMDTLLDAPESLRKRYKEQAGRCPVKFIYDSLAAIRECDAAYRGATNQRLLMEFTLMKLSFLQGGVQGAVSAAPAVSAVKASAMEAAAAGARTVPSVPVAPSVPAAPSASAAPSALAAPSASGMVKQAEPSVPAASAEPVAAVAPRTVTQTADPVQPSLPTNPVVPEIPVTESASVQPDPAAAQPASALSASQEAPASSVAQPASAPSASQEAPASRRPHKRASSLSISAIMQEEVNEAAEQTSGESDSVPEDDTLKEKWIAVAEQVSDPRLVNSLVNAALEISEEDGRKVVSFFVMNEAQKRWIEEKHLLELETKHRGICGTSKILLKVAVIPSEKVEEKPYMPEDQARDLIAKNEKVRDFVVELGLDI